MGTHEMVGVPIGDDRMNSYTIKEIGEAIFKAKVNRIVVMTNEILIFSNDSTYRPTEAFSYDYETTREKIRKYDDFIRKAKHVAHKFSLSFFVDEYNMTLDEFKIYYDYLADKRNKLKSFLDQRPMTRRIVGSHVEYSYINFDKDEVKKEYEATCEEFDKAYDVKKHISETIKFNDPSFVLEEMTKETPINKDYYYNEEFGQLMRVSSPISIYDMY